MNKPTKVEWIYFIVLFATYLAIGLTSTACDYLIHDGSLYFLPAMIIFAPLASLVVPFIHSLRHGFYFWWIAPPLVASFTILWDFYEGNMLIFSWCYMGLALIGSLLGAVIRDKILKKRAQ
ncbi:hypothetical protein [Alloscardovia omnicolens]|uniref:hypothetical protein n=1 Tax=Alloscardovia omnicolens TaxID=419015 RepID=UPI003A70807A